MNLLNMYLSVFVISFMDQWLCWRPLSPSRYKFKKSSHPFTKVFITKLSKVLRVNKLGTPTNCCRGYMSTQLNIVTSLCAIFASSIFLLCFVKGFCCAFVYVPPKTPLTWLLKIFGGNKYICTSNVILHLLSVTFTFIKAIIAWYS